MINSYSVSTDVFAIIVKTPPDGCVDYDDRQVRVGDIDKIMGCF